MPRISLTDATVRALKPTGKQDTYWCNLTPNFGLRVSQRGGKSFFVMLGRARKRAHLGKYPATSLRQARKSKAITPLIPRHVAGGKTLADTFETYFRSAIEPNYKPRQPKDT